jgi:hypothetical protein
MSWILNKKSGEEDVEVVACFDCGSIVKKDETKEVAYGSRQFYFCRTHRPPFDKISLGRYYGTVEMDYKGTPIGYKKITSKK